MHRFLIAGLFLAVTALPAVDSWRWDHQPGSSLSLRAGARLLWTFHYAAVDNTPWFHPLATTAGTVLSDCAPADHRWHRGLWFSWKFINGANYWEQPYEGLSVCSGLVTVRENQIGAIIALPLEYRHQDQVVMREQRILVASLPRSDGSYTLDWDMTFTALAGEVILDRTPLVGEVGGQSWGGYSGLSFRMPRMVTQLTFLNSAGKTGSEAHGQPACWVDLSASYPDGNQGGVALFGHPDNPRHPEPWYLGSASLPFLGAAPLYRSALTLTKDQTLRLRYRALIHQGHGNPSSLAQEWSTWTAAPGPK